MRRAWLVVMVAVTWPSWTVLLWTAVWVVLFLAALLWGEAP